MREKRDGRMTSRATNWSEERPTQQVVHRRHREKDRFPLLFSAAAAATAIARTDEKALGEGNIDGTGSCLRKSKHSGNQSHFCPVENYVLIIDVKCPLNDYKQKKKIGRSEWFNDKQCGESAKIKTGTRTICDCSLYLTSAIQNRRKTTVMRLILSIS